MGRMGTVNRELLLLGLLRRQDMHGYQLSEFIARDLSACTDLKKPTAYFLLNKMAQEGWISQEKTQEGNRPPRHVYRITPQGEAAFQRLLRQSLAAFEPVYFAGDISLAFIEELPTDEAVTLLAARRQEMQSALSKLQEAPVHHGSLQLAIDHQRYHLENELAWLNRMIAGLHRETALPDPENQS